jgi:hypothetical protein
MNKKQLIVAWIIIIALLIISSTVIMKSGFSLEVYTEIPNGYGKVNFGMLKGQVKQILSNEGSVITIETNTVIVIPGELLGEKVNIAYSFTPITQKCMNISIYFPPTDIKALQERVRKILIEKYGKPYTDYVDGVSLPLWEWGNIKINLLKFERDNLLILSYVDQNLVDISREEQKKLDM